VQPAFYVFDEFLVCSRFDAGINCLIAPTQKHAYCLHAQHF
jgi:hypothetical protein